MAEVKGNGNVSYLGCLAYGPFEVKNLRYFTCDKRYARKAVEVLRPSENGGPAVVRYLGLGTGAFTVYGTRLEPLA